jgi:type II secretory pathway component GspD/PulD (secretin)
LNNRTARIRKGDKLYYFEEYKLQTVDNGDKGKDQILVPSGKPTAMALGITFDVKPNVGVDGKTILLGLKPEIITFQAWEDYSSSQTTTENKVTTTTGTQVKLPRTHEQTIATSVAINSGETVILGGMVENRETTEVRKVPLLGDIPYLGALFTHVEKVHEPMNLLIFVTATVLNANGEYVIVAP